MKGLECIVNGCSYHNSSGSCHTLTFWKWMSDGVALPENTICTFTLMYMVVVSEKWMIVPSSICWCMLFSEKKAALKNIGQKKSLGHFSKIPLKPVMKNSPFSTSGPQGCHSGVRLCRVFPLGSSAGLMQVRIKDGGVGRGGETHVKNGGFQYGCKTQATVGKLVKVSLFNGSRQEFGSSKVTCGFAKQSHVCICYMFV